MKRLSLAFVLLCLAIGSLHAASQAAGSTPTPAAQPAPAVVLHRLLLADSEAAAQAMVDPGEGHTLVLQGLPLFDTAEFRSKMEPFFGKPVSNDLVKEIAVVVSAYVREKDRLTVNIAIANPNASNGVVRLAIQIGRYRDILVKGNHWFSAKLIEEKLGVKPGDEIRVSQLDQAISWINTNPFRYTKAVINNRTGDPTRADLIVAVQDAAPFRLIGTYDNSGVKMLGMNRYTAAFQWGNAWGLDHQLTYQYSRSDVPNHFQAHSLDYKIPLPWHHIVQFDFAYADMSVLIATIGGGLTYELKGSNDIVDVHYVIPVSMAPWTIEYSLGVDFKRSDNNLEFGGVSAYGRQIDVLQGTASATFVRKDKLGGWSLALGANLSPGGMTPNQTKGAYQSVRMYSSPSYIYGTIAVQRLTALGHDWQWVVKANGQIASTNLVGSEQMSIGGFDTVRGYDERISSADMGIVANTELQTPVFNLKVPRIPKVLPEGSTFPVRFLAFYDAGDVKFHRRDSGVRLDPMMSTGVGLRCSLGRYVSASFDYGWRVRKVSVAETGAGRGHIRVSVSY